ncbi:TetR family transcriptional regulator [Nitriliruptor alkaliphilus]|uniref:TetR family transcriptional regulator n=1 Tax=Nitriliruptor alkaliphilus TaxID=427918 RepID=UPI00069859C0|nr:TetR family transcriptional regulator [Nitriliruptor alkaliphilus]
MSSEDTRLRILDAALTVMSRYGLARLALEDVAREAGVSRQTVYRYVGSRDGLISDTIVREEQAFFDRMREAAAEHDRLRPALEASIAAALRLAREHPLLDRLLATEPEALLPFLTDGSGPVLSAARPVVIEVLGRFVPHLSAADLARTADAASRLIVSYAISPAEEPVEELAAGLAAMMADGVDAGVDAGVSLRP